MELLVQVSGVKKKTRANRSKTTKNIKENPDLPIPRRSFEWRFPKTSLHRILHTDLSLKTYKV